MFEKWQNHIPEPIKGFASDVMKDPRLQALLFKGFSLSQVPLLFLTSPKISKLDETSCHILMPFRKIVKNHLGSLYFGALAIGADTCVGALAFHKIKQTQQPVSLVFKDFQANFLKRAVGPTYFICNQGKPIQDLVEKAIESKERVHATIEAHAEVHSEIVATFQLTLSLKLKV